MFYGGIIIKILLIYPEYPITYWGFQYALKFISKKASFPPLGLLTIASMLPDNYEKKFIDMNVEKLRDKDISWADYVFISAMVVQKESVKIVVERCKKLGVKTVAGGPLFTAEYNEYNEIDHLLLNEGEITVPSFLHDIETGKAEHIYTTTEWADIRTTPVPKWDLIKINKYATMNIQYSRGCPFNCDFCNVTSLFGHTSRTKDADQLIEELNALYLTGWRGGVFFVDDNFIGNKAKLKKEILPAIIKWMENKKYPFTFLTESSINLSDDDELINMMVKAGFNCVFIGIETPNEESLIECSKVQNNNRDLIKCVKKLQNSGLQVQGGFIVGFDNDKDNIFDRMITFIQESGIVTAMVGLLNAPKGTKLYQRMAGEGRLNDNFSGDNTNLTMNFIPKMDKANLVKGYKKIIDTIYSPKKYYNRVITFLKEYNYHNIGLVKINFSHVKTFLKSIIRLGIIGRERRFYWRLIFWSLFKKPYVFPLAVTLSIYGFHFRKTFKRLYNQLD